MLDAANDSFVLTPKGYRALLRERENVGLQIELVRRAFDSAILVIQSALGVTGDGIPDIYAPSIRSMLDQYLLAELAAATVTDCGFVEKGGAS